MREVAEKSVGWLVLAGIILAVLLARKRGQDRSARASADAYAAGFAEGGAAAATANAAQHVQVAVDASHRGMVEHRCDDPFSCAVCGPVVDRILLAARTAGRVPAGERRERLPAGSNHHDDRRSDNYDGIAYYDHNTPHPDDCADFRATLDAARRDERIDAGDSEGDRNVGDRRVAAVGVGQPATPIMNRGLDGDVLYRNGRGRGPGR